MKCEDCSKCREVKYKNGVFQVNCLNNDVFQIHESNVPNFECEDYEYEAPQAPHKENILIILKSGRELIVYDKDITCNDDMERRLLATADWVEFDGMLINKREIAVLSYVHS